MKLNVGNMNLDFAYLIGLTCFSILFYFNITIIFLTNFVIISSFVSLGIKLISWYNINKKRINNCSYTTDKYFFLKFTSCVLTYIVPVYCIIQEPKLIISHNIATITFAMVSIFAITGVIIWRKFVITKNIDV